MVSVCFWHCISTQPSWCVNLVISFRYSIGYSLLSGLTLFLALRLEAAIKLKDFNSSISKKWGVQTHSLVDGFFLTALITWSTMLESLPAKQILNFSISSVSCRIYEGKWLLPKTGFWGLSTRPRITPKSKIPRIQIPDFLIFRVWVVSSRILRLKPSQRLIGSLCM